MTSALLRSLRVTQSRTWSQRRPCLQRGIRSSFPVRTDLAPEPPSREEELENQQLEELAEDIGREAESAPEPSADTSAPSEESFTKFMDTVAPRYEYASPQNWLGDAVPFPLNKSFKPPPPISDAQRNEMYRLYIADPDKNNVRVLSQRFHISLDRVDAILRLKGMQDDWIKGNTLQTGFVRGMERLLAVPEFRTASSSELTLEEMRHDVHEADTLEESEQNDPARQRYQRMYWESLPEFGGEAIVPTSLERSRSTAKHLAAKASQIKDRQYLPAIPDTDTIRTPKEHIQISGKEGRPDVHFIDVGTKFLDIASETKRLARIESRARFRAKKVART